MARMYSRARGKSGSKKPSKRTTPTWMRYTSKEIEMLVVKLAKERKTPSQIGLYLRDVYGIPDVNLITKKKITKILAEHNLLQQIPEDLTALIKKSIMLKKHLDANKQDMAALRGLQITESKIKKLIKYYKKTKKIPVEWKYDPKMAGLFIE